MRIAILIIAAIIIMPALATAEVTETSWYSNYETKNRRCADNRWHDLQKELCAASWDYDLGTRVKVSLLDTTNISVVVTIVDRGPAWEWYYKGRRLDLSIAAFKKLANPDVGHIDVRVERCKDIDQ